MLALCFYICYHYGRDLVIVIASSPDGYVCGLFVGRPGHPYFCEHCDYTAMFQCDMKRHQRCHETGKRFKCTICDFATNWERSFQVHNEQIHKDKEPWKCDKCDTKIYNHHKVSVMFYLYGEAKNKINVNENNLKFA